jgi:hypothetical protein
LINVPNKRSVSAASFRRDSVNPADRGKLSAERADVILKSVVKRFFNEKEVTSTLVMDALYSGCRALQQRNSALEVSVPHIHACRDVGSWCCGQWLC